MRQLLARRRAEAEGLAVAVSPARTPAPVRVAGTMPIAEVTWRSRVTVGGRVRSVRVQPWAGVATLECTVVDGTGGIVVVFLGRRHIAGIRPGTRIVCEGMAGEHRGTLAMLNPDYRLIDPQDATGA